MGLNKQGNLKPTVQIQIYTKILRCRYRHKELRKDKPFLTAPPTIDRILTLDNRNEWINIQYFVLIGKREFEFKNDKNKRNIYNKSSESDVGLVAKILRKQGD